MVPPLRRMAAAGAELLRANFASLKRPLKVNLCITYWCQYRCQTCNIWKRKPENELTTDELIAFVENNAETAWLDVTGGEIFLREDIDQVLLAIAQRWDRLSVLHFPTNGFLTSKIVSVTTRLAQTRRVPIVVTVSLDGHEALNDRIRGIRGGYQRQLETFRALRQVRGVKAVLGMTLSSLNIDQIDATLEACQRDCPGLTIDDFHVNVAQRSAHYYGNEQHDSFEAATDPLRHQVTLYRKRRSWSGAPSDVVEQVFLRYLDRFLASGRTPMPCHALRSSCFIDPWGTVYPCITYAKPLGSLRDTAMDLGPIWSSHLTRETQHEIWQGQCPQCWTACEAYQSILGNALAPWRWRSPSMPVPLATAPGNQQP
ncbi:MAG: radical SAM protein [Vicinamibacterales bacterium]